MIIAAVHLHVEAPLIWHSSQAFTLSKANGKKDCAGLRLVHSLDPFGKAFYKYLWRANYGLTIAASRNYAYGYLKHRRREGAILVQSLVQERLREAGHSYSTEFYDATNAFHSVSHDMLMMFIRLNADEFATALFAQRLQHGHVSLACVDGILEMGIGSGTLPGDSIACLWFLGPYHWSVDGIVSPECPGLSVTIPWLKHCLADDVSDRVRLCSWSQQPIEISLTSFADDLARTQLVRSLEGLIRINNTNTEHLKDRLSIVNVQANSGKQECL
eukprot:3738803-Pyramimonas_sp.AAC.1